MSILRLDSKIVGTALLALSLTTSTKAAQTWTSWNSSFRGGTLKVIVPNALVGEQSRILSLVNWADRSLVSTTPLSTQSTGYIRPGDVVVVKDDLLLWFDKTTGGTTTLNGGGGMLRGVWPLARDGSGSLNFSRIVNANNYAPNLMYCGNTPNVQGSGISLLGNYGTANVDNGVTWGIEHEGNAAITGATGVSISMLDSGLYASQDGVFVQFSGQVANSPGTLPAGIGSHYDVDFRSGIEGRCNYTLTYRLPRIGRVWRQEISLQVTQNNFGPLSTAVISHNYASYTGSHVKYVSDPDLNGDYRNRGWIVPDATVYFTMAGYSPRFYSYPWIANSSRPSATSWLETVAGTGKMLGFGAPTITPAAPFIEFRPVASGLPASLQSTHVLQAIDNRASGARSNAMDWQLFDTNRGHSPYTLGSGGNLYLTTDYGFH